VGNSKGGYGGELKQFMGGVLGIVAQNSGEDSRKKKCI